MQTTLKATSAICLMLFVLISLRAKEPTEFMAIPTMKEYNENELHEQLAMSQPEYQRGTRTKAELNKTEKRRDVAENDTSSLFAITKHKKRNRQKSAKFGPGVTQIKPEESVTSLGGPVWRVFFSMMILIGLIIGTLYCLKRLGKRFGKLPTDAKINILTKLQIDSKNSLLMIKVYEQELLLGVTNENISVLSKYHSLAQEDDDDDNMTEDSEDNDTNITGVGKSDFKVVNSDIVVDIKNLKSWSELK